MFSNRQSIRQLTWLLTALLLVMVVFVALVDQVTSPGPDPGFYAEITAVVAAATTDAAGTAGIVWLPGEATPIDRTPFFNTLATMTLTPSATPVSASATPEPVTATLVPLTPQPTLATHLVQRGETAFLIAQRYGVPYHALITLNNLVNPNVITVGQLLLIPPPDVPVDPAAAVAYWLTLTPAPLTVADAGEDAPGDATRLKTVNGLDVTTFVIMPDDVRQHVREIYAAGQRQGRNPHAFAKLGDSTIENPFFMDRFDTGPYNLGDYAYLQPTIDYYTGSFARDSVAVRVGLHTWSIFDAMWARKPPCLPAEHMLDCELRLHNPAILFIRMGSNDAGIPDSVDKNLRRVVDYCLERGIIPVMGTKADRFEGPGNLNNEIIRQIAVDYQIPLWDFDLLAGTIPGRGLTADRVHMTSYYAHDWRVPQALQTGHGVHSLTGLMVLEAIRSAVLEAADLRPYPAARADTRDW